MQYLLNKYFPKTLNDMLHTWTNEHTSFDWVETFVVDEIPMDDLWDCKSTELRLKLNNIHKSKGVVKECTRHFMAFTPTLPPTFDNVFDAFKNKSYSYNFLKITPSYLIPMHYDSYSTFCKKFNVDEDNIENINRTVIMMSDWSQGQVLQVKDDIYANWKAGDTFTWKGQEWHGAANFGFEDFVVMQVTWL